MMSLYALGMELEPAYGSVPFLFYNICLIPLTTITMMALVWLQIRWTGNEQLKKTKTVGYSAVLFAWMVVSSLERESTCPVPFVPDLCFKTYVIGMPLGAGRNWALKFNLGPMVQLLIAQVIMPRVSFVGHLAGIVCGFVLHWNLLPKEVFWMPQVLIPMILLLSCCARRIVSFRCSYDRIPALASDNDEDEDTGPSTMMEVSAGGRRKPENQRRMRQLLICVRNGMVATAVICPAMFNSFGSIVLSQMLVSTFVVFSVQRWLLKDRTRDASTLWKATIVSLVLTLVTDAMHFPYWTCMSSYIGAKWIVSSSSMVLELFLLLRCTVNFVALLLASEILLTEGGDIRGIFDHVLGWAVRYCHMLVMPLQRLSSVSNFTPFQGQGVALGQV